MQFPERLSDYEIGGIGEIKRKTLRFHSYTRGMEGGEPALYAVYEKDAPPKLIEGYPDGQALLVELCDLHLALRGLRFEAQTDRIERWCIEHVHPYYPYGDMERSAKYQNDPEEYRDFFVNTIEAFCFPVAHMCADLERLYNDAMTAFSLRALAEDEKYQAKRYWSRIHPSPKENLIQKWYEERPERRPRLIDQQLAQLPRFTMALDRDEQSGKLVLVPEVTSVFEAAYYALYRFAAVNAGMLSDYGGKTSLAFCQACGRAFIKNGNRQKYCADPVCQSVRNQRKSRDYYYRERKKEIARELEELL